METYNTTNYIITVDSYRFAWFEHRTKGEYSSGRMYFDANGMIDYDGAYDIPAEVVDIMTSAGFNMDGMS